MEHRVTNEGAREGNHVAEGVCRTIGGTQYELTSTPQSSLGLNHQLKKTHRENHGWNIGECLDQEVGMGGLGSRQRAERIGDFRRGIQERG
jgi:hypothetical protein